MGSILASQGPISRLYCRTEASLAPILRRVYNIPHDKELRAEQPVVDRILNVIRPTSKTSTRKAEQAPCALCLGSFRLNPSSTKSGRSFIALLGAYHKESDKAPPGFPHRSVLKGWLFCFVNETIRRGKNQAIVQNIERHRIQGWRSSACPTTSIYGRM